jgi:hypothetical protein
LFDQQVLQLTCD